MGTRADFYYEDTKKQLHWIGSIGWDGYARGVDFLYRSPKTIPEFKTRVAKFLSTREDATLPKQGWPWPWETSKTTDYAYIFRKGKVYVSNYGSNAIEVENAIMLEERANACRTASFAVNDYSKHAIKAELVRELESVQADINKMEAEAYEISEVKFEFPDMTSIQKISYGPNSGLLIIGGAK